MAITSESQILDVHKVKNATAYLDDAAVYLRQARESLLNGKEKCGANVILIDGKSPYNESIDILIAEIEAEITTIVDYSTKIKSDANVIYSNERKSYDNYLEAEKKKKEEAEKAAKSNTPTAVKL